MSNFLNLFPSKYLAASDLDGDDRDVMIKGITASEEVGQNKDKRPILHFQSVAKGMVLNKTNAKRIAKLFGNDTDNWIGQTITLYPSECDFGDETVPCLRVRPEAPQQDDADEMTDEQLEAEIRRRKAKRSTVAS